MKRLFIRAAAPALLLNAYLAQGLMTFGFVSLGLSVAKTTMRWCVWAMKQELKRVPSA